MGVFAVKSIVIKGARWFAIGLLSVVGVLSTYFRDYAVELAYSLGLSAQSAIEIERAGAMGAVLLFVAVALVLPMKIRVYGVAIAAAMMLYAFAAHTPALERESNRLVQLEPGAVATIKPLSWEATELERSYVRVTKDTHRLVNVIMRIHGGSDTVPSQVPKEIRLPNQ